MLLRALLLPLAALLIGVGVLIGGKVGPPLVICGTVLAGVATVLVLINA